MVLLLRHTEEDREHTYALSVFYHLLSNKIIEVRIGKWEVVLLDYPDIPVVIDNFIDIAPVSVPCVSAIGRDRAIAVKILQVP